MNNIEILEKLKDEQYDKETLKTICEFYDEEFKPYVLSTEEREAIEDLIKENKELKEITQSYNSFKADDLDKIVLADINYFTKGYFKNNFIEKSKVKEKIEELDSIYQQEIKQKYNGRYYHQLSYAIQILKELEEGE